MLLVITLLPPSGSSADLKTRSNIYFNRNILQEMVKLFFKKKLIYWLDFRLMDQSWPYLQFIYIMLWICLFLTQHFPKYDGTTWKHIHIVFLPEITTWIPKKNPQSFWVGFHYCLHHVTKRHLIVNTCALPLDLVGQ